MKVLHRDPHLVIVHKPAGWLVYRDDRADPTPSCKEELEKGGRSKVWPVHRLDKETNGVLVFALNAETAADLLKAFSRGGTQKEYLAIVHGDLTAARSVRKPLAKNKSSEKVPARTDLEPEGGVQWGGSPWSAVTALPRTGRYHQIRRHLADEGFPIVGDEAYRKREFTDRERGLGDQVPLCLCARAIEFTHPRTKKKLRVETRPDSEMVAVARKLGLL